MYIVDALILMVSFVKSEDLIAFELKNPTSLNITFLGAI